MDAPVQYMHELRDELSLYPTWFPFDRVEVGAYGTLKRGKFYVDGMLSDLDIAMHTDEQQTDGNLKKSQGVAFTSRSNSQATAGLIDLSVGVDVHFERAHSWAFAAKGVSTLRITNIAEVRRGVLEAQRRGDWRSNWLLVTELRKTAMLNVLVARSRNVSGRVTARGTLAAADVLLGEDAAFDFQADDVFMVEKHRNGTPLYGLRKLKGLFRPDLEPTAGGPASDVSDESGLEIADDESFGFDQ